jgi:hypothetical protein
MPVRPLTRFVTVRAGERFLLGGLGKRWKCKYTKSAPQWEKKAQLSTVHTEPSHHRL